MSMSSNLALLIPVNSNLNYYLLKQIRELIYFLHLKYLVIKNIYCTFAKSKVLMIMRKQTTVRLPEYMLTDLHVEARKKGISVSRLIEDSLESVLYQPNADTLEALEEARSGVEMEKVDLSSFDAFIKSMER